MGARPTPDPPGPPARVATPPTPLVQGKGSRIPAGPNDQRPGSRSSVTHPHCSCNGVQIFRSPVPSPNDVWAKEPVPVTGRRLGWCLYPVAKLEGSEHMWLAKARGVSRASLRQGFMCCFFSAEPIVWWSRIWCLVFQSTSNKTTLCACWTIPYHCYKTCQNLQHTPSLGRHGAAASFAVQAATTVPWWLSSGIQEKSIKFISTIPNWQCAQCWIIWGCFQFDQNPHELSNLLLASRQGTGRSLWRNEDRRKQLLLPASKATPDVRRNSTRVDAVEGHLLSVSIGERKKNETSAGLALV